MGGALDDLCASKEKYSYGERPWSTGVGGIQLYCAHTLIEFKLQVLCSVPGTNAQRSETYRPTADGFATPLP